MIKLLIQKFSECKSLLLYSTHTFISKIYGRNNKSSMLLFYSEYQDNTLVNTIHF